MAIAQGQAPLHGTGATESVPVTFTITLPDGTALSGYVMGTTAGIAVTHNAQNDVVPDGAGEIVGVFGWGEHLEASFELLPAAASLASARISATIPPLMSIVSISGADVVPVGPFSDAINVTTGTPGGNKWIYIGGGTLNFRNNAPATMTLPLRRYPKIPGGVAINT